VPEPKIGGSTAESLDDAVQHLADEEALRQELSTENKSLRTENAGLREALEASEAECAKVIEERDRVRVRVDDLEKDITCARKRCPGCWHCRGEYHVDERDRLNAEAERDAMRPVVEAAVAWRQALGISREVMAFGAIIGKQSKAILAAVDSYTPVLEPGRDVMSDKQTASIDFMMRPNPYPDLKPGDEVTLPPELGGRRGTIRWSDGSDRSWAVSVPYGGDGALVYVHKADVRPLSAPSEPVQDQPRVWAMPEIPEDVTRLSALAGDLICERDEYDPRVWACRSAATGRVLALIRTGELLDRYAPLTEVVEPDGD
jgi:hypothetical protein